MTLANSPSPMDDDHTWQSHPAIARARAWTLRRVDEIRYELAGLEKQAPALRCIVLSGSLARLDACPQSDADLIVVLGDKTPLDSDEARDVARAAGDRLESLGLRRPQSSGVFVSPTSRRQLCDGPRGIVDEAVDVFGKRIQLLLEARAVLGSTACTQLQRDILLRYVDHPFAQRPGQRWNYLTDDLIRYWRSYRVWRHWDITETNGGWFVRNLKLRYSRLLTFASLLLACVTDIGDRRTVEALLALIPLTPLERIRRCEQQLGGHEFDTVCRLYEGFLQVANDAEHRMDLEGEKLVDPRAGLRNASPAFQKLVDDSDDLRAALWRLLRHLPDDVLAGIVV